MEQAFEIIFHVSFIFKILIFSTVFLLGVIVLKQPSLFVATISIFVNLPITMRALI